MSLSTKGEIAVIALRMEDSTRSTGPPECEIPGKDFTVCRSVISPDLLAEMEVDSKPVASDRFVRLYHSVKDGCVNPAVSFPHSIELSLLLNRQGFCKRLFADGRWRR